ncbi:MAG: apolipoprotein N-acyltransferase [Hyphomicrobiaceae bacterium]|jgi:apolipoprotein N-acyltransferase
MKLKVRVLGATSVASGSRRCFYRALCMMLDPKNTRAQEWKAAQLSTYAYGQSWRVLLALLALTGFTGSSVLALVLMFADQPPDNPLHLIRLFTGSALLPFAAMLCIRRLHRTRLTLDKETLILAQYGQTIEVPFGTIASIEPWSLPLPNRGLWLRFNSEGVSSSIGIEVPNTAEFGEFLGLALKRPIQSPSKPSPLAAYVAELPRFGVKRAFLTFAGFALVPTLPLFRVHQYIAYGGTFGEYYQYGAWAWLLGFVIYWASLTIYLVLYWTVLRCVFEPLTALSTVVASNKAGSLRLWSERVQGFLYFVGVPTVVILRFIPW